MFSRTVASFRGLLRSTSIPTGNYFALKLSDQTGGRCRGLHSDQSISADPDDSGIHPTENPGGADDERHVLTDRSGEVFLIALNRPEKRNCINEETARQLLLAVKEFEQDKSTKVAVIYGKGGCFCAGWDLTALSDKDESWAKKMPFLPGPIGPSRNFVSKPMIAAVNGYAVAGGLELALLCDLRVAEEEAVFGVFCRRYGVPLVDGGTVRLPALIGFSRAMDLILTGRPVSGQEAVNMGLVNKMVGRGSVVGQAIQLANAIAKYPQECMLADRKSAYYAAYNAKSYEDALAFEHEHGQEIIVKEAIKDFISAARGSLQRVHRSRGTEQEKTSEVVSSELIVSSLARSALKTPDGPNFWMHYQEIGGCEPPWAQSMDEASCGLQCQAFSVGDLNRDTVWESRSFSRKVFGTQAYTQIHLPFGARTRLGHKFSREEYRLVSFAVGAHGFVKGLGRHGKFNFHAAKIDEAIQST